MGDDLAAVTRRRVRPRRPPLTRAPESDVAPPGGVWRAFGLVLSLDPLMLQSRILFLVQIDVQLLFCSVASKVIGFSHF